MLTNVLVVIGLGGRGDTVMVKKSLGRNKLLPEGLAVYPSPENKQIFAEELRVSTISQFVHLFPTSDNIIQLFDIVTSYSHSFCVKGSQRRGYKHAQDCW